MGWIFHPDFWRRGYERESCQALVDYAFEQRNTREVWAEIIDGQKSVGLMKKLKMELVRIEKEGTKDQVGQLRDLCICTRSQTDEKEPRLDSAELQAGQFS